MRQVRQLPRILAQCLNQLHHSVPPLDRVLYDLLLNPVPEHTALGFVVIWIMTNIVKAAVKVVSWHVIKSFCFNY